MNKKFFLGLLLVSAVAPVTQSVDMNDTLMALRCDNSVVLYLAYRCDLQKNPRLVGGIRFASGLLQCYLEGCCSGEIVVGNNALWKKVLAVLDVAIAMRIFYLSEYSLPSRLLGFTLSAIGFTLSAIGSEAGQKYLGNQRRMQEIQNCSNVFLQLNRYTYKNGHPFPSALFRVIGEYVIRPKS